MSAPVKVATLCPCGCLTADECVTSRPIRRPRPVVPYDVVTLGLTCDHGDGCEAKR